MFYFWWASFTVCSGDIQRQTFVLLLIEHGGCRRHTADVYWGWRSTKQGRIFSGGTAHRSPEKIILFFDCRLEQHDIQLSAHRLRSHLLPVCQLVLSQLHKLPASQTKVCRKSATFWLPFSPQTFSNLYRICCLNWNNISYIVLYFQNKNVCFCV